VGPRKFRNITPLFKVAHGSSSAESHNFSKPLPPQLFDGESSFIDVHSECGHISTIIPKRIQTLAGKTLDFVKIWRPLDAIDTIGDETFLYTIHYADPALSDETPTIKVRVKGFRLGTAHLGEYAKKWYKRFFFEHSNTFPPTEEWITVEKEARFTLQLNPQAPPMNFVKIKTLGKGSFGTVSLFRTIWTRWEIAVKLPNKPRGLDADIKILQKLIKHKICPSSYIPSIPIVKPLFKMIIMPPARDSLKKLYKEVDNGVFSKEQLAKAVAAAIWQTTRDVRCLLKHKIVFTDLKPANVLFRLQPVGEDSVRMVVQLGDLGSISSLGQRGVCTYRPERAYCKSKSVLSSQEGLVFLLGVFTVQMLSQVDPKIDMYEKTDGSVTRYSYYFSHSAAPDDQKIPLRDPHEPQGEVKKSKLATAATAAAEPTYHQRSAAAKTLTFNIARSLKLNAYYGLEVTHKLALLAQKTLMSWPPPPGQEKHFTIDWFINTLKTIFT